MFSYLKIRYKLLLIVLVFFALIVDLSALNIAAVTDIREETAVLAQKEIPELILSSEVRESVNVAVISLLDYTNTKRINSREDFRSNITDAEQTIVAFRNTTTGDESVLQALDRAVKKVREAGENLVTAIESDATQETVQERLTALEEERDLFSAFIAREIELRTRTQADVQLEQSSSRLQQTIINISTVGVIAVLVLLGSFLFIRRTITKPISQLRKTAEHIGRGEFIHAEVHSRDELGVLARTINTMTDHLQDAQHALELELTKTKVLDRQKSEFLSIAAHQLRTPMSGIKWAVSMIVEGDFGNVDQEAQKQLGLTLENINRMIRLINQLLDVSRIETKAAELQFHPHNITALVQDVLPEYSQVADEHGVQLQWVAPVGQIPEVVLDLETIRLVIQNLVDNALKYTPKGGSVRVGLRVRDDMIEIAVADTGHGIPVEERERVFSKFYRGSNIQQIQADGSGLGLYLVKEIVTQHGGDIRFNSKEGVGTVFIVSLPITGPSAKHPAHHTESAIDPQILTHDVRNVIDETLDDAAAAADNNVA